MDTVAVWDVAPSCWNQCFSHINGALQKPGSSQSCPGNSRGLYFMLLVVREMRSSDGAKLYIVPRCYVRGTKRRFMPFTEIFLTPIAKFCMFTHP